MDKNLIKLAFMLGYKSAGPTLKEKVDAGVPGAREQLEKRKAEEKYRYEHPNPLGSLVKQKAYLIQEGKKQLAKLPPEKQEQFRNDSSRFQGVVNAVRGMGIMLSGPALSLPFGASHAALGLGFLQAAPYMSALPDKYAPGYAAPKAPAASTTGSAVK